MSNEKDALLETVSRMKKVLEAAKGLAKEKKETEEPTEETETE